MVVNEPVPVNRGRKDVVELLGSGGNSLDDVVRRGGIIPAHFIAVDDEDVAVFSASDGFMRSTGAVVRH
jgi:hypothetical protein